MKKFQVRVVLKDADWDDYEVLHAAMEKRGFSRTVKSDSGKTYHLPDAEYRYEGDIDLEAVGKRVSQAAEETEKKYAWIANEVRSSRWHGLDSV